MEKGYLIRKVSEVEAISDICGEIKTLTSFEDFSNASIAHVKVSESKPHYHKETTEFYFILKGEGIIRINEEEVEVEKGMLVMIRPGSVHSIKAFGEIELLVIASPAWRIEDQFEV
jgi:mannose-6-phosphate isomerase-like protein (cupin superfamily)